MAMGNLLKWLIRDDTAKADENDDVYYHPNRRREESLVEEPENVTEDDSFQTLRVKKSPLSVEPDDGEVSDLDFAPLSDEAQEPDPETNVRFLALDGIAAVQNAVDLMLEGRVVLVNFDQMEVEDVTAGQCYLAGAIHAVHGHITPVDDSNAFISIDEFDVTPYLPDEDEEDA